VPDETFLFPVLDFKKYQNKANYFLLMLATCLRQTGLATAENWRERQGLL
jgi:hypothetical protein